MFAYKYQEYKDKKCRIVMTMDLNQHIDMTTFTKKELESIKLNDKMILKKYEGWHSTCCYKNKRSYLKQSYGETSHIDYINKKAKANKDKKEFAGAGYNDLIYDTREFKQIEDPNDPDNIYNQLHVLESPEELLSDHKLVYAYLNGNTESAKGKISYNQEIFKNLQKNIPCTVRNVKKVETDKDIVISLNTAQKIFSNQITGSEIDSVRRCHEFYGKEEK